jgi:hypothetical protein
MPALNISAIIIAGKAKQRTIKMVGNVSNFNDYFFFICKISIWYLIKKKDGVQNYLLFFVLFVFFFVCHFCSRSRKLMLIFEMVPKSK